MDRCVIIEWSRVDSPARHQALGLQSSSFFMPPSSVFWIVGGFLVLVTSPVQPDSMSYTSLAAGGCFLAGGLFVFLTTFFSWRNLMHSITVLYVTAALMAFVAVSCTALCIAWSIPSWRRRLTGPGVASQAREPEIRGLTGWSSRVCSGLVSTGIAACAAIAWHGSYSVLAALIATSR